MTLAQRRYHSLLAQAPPRKPNILEQGRQQTAARVLGPSRIGGFLIIVPSGGGKSIFLGKRIAFADIQNRIPQVIIDVGGQTIQNFLHRLLFLSEVEQREILSRVVYCDMAGQDGFVTSWPLLRPRTPDERPYVTASRLPELLALLDEKFANATIQGLTRAIPIAVATGKLLTALRLSITEVFALLRYPERWVERITEAVRRHPECASAAADLFDYMEIPKRQRNERIEPFLNRLQLLRHDEVARALFGSMRPPTIDFERVSSNCQTVLVDVSRTAKLSRQFALQFVFNLLLEYLEQRGRGQGPISVLIDELSFFVKGTEYLNTKAIAEQFRQFIEQHMRNNEVYLTLASQDLGQVPPEMLSAVLNMKNMLIGTQSDPETAEYLANRFVKRNPWEVKHWERVWTSDQLNGMPRHFVIDHRPVFMPLEEQLYLSARDFMELPKGTFLFAESSGEGQVPTAVRRVTARYLYRPPFVSDNKELLAKLRWYLSRRDGIPVAEVLAEIDNQAIGKLPEPVLPEKPQPVPVGVKGGGEALVAEPSSPAANGQPEKPPHGAPHGENKRPAETGGFGKREG